MTATAMASRPARTARKHPDRKTPRSWRRKALALTAIVLVLTFLGASLWIVYFSSVLVTKRVNVVGIHELTPAQVSLAVQIPLGVPLARQDLGEIVARATTLPAVEAATVTRNWPNTITVSVVERRPVLAMHQPGGYVIVDRLGVAYQTQLTLPPNIVLAEVNPGDAPLLSEVAIVAAALPDALRRKVNLITASNRESIALILGSGPSVTWGNSADSELKAQVVLALLKRKPQTSIDVSSPHNPAVR
jgi:cell division protein FtsQ